MEKHEILNLILTKSDRVKIKKDEKYEAEFPNQCQLILVDGIKTKFYKCDICVQSKSLITCGARNVKDSIRKHFESNHEKLFAASGAKRQFHGKTLEPVNQKRLKPMNSKFQISHLDKKARENFGKKIAIWQASNDIPYNAIDDSKFGEVLKSFAGKNCPGILIYHMFTQK